MSKKYKLIIIPIIIIISIFVFIGTSKSVTTRFFKIGSQFDKEDTLYEREDAEGKGESIFCLAEGLQLNGHLSQVCKINIGGYADNVIKPTAGTTIENGVEEVIKGTTAYKYTETDTNNRTSVDSIANAKLAYIFYKARGENVTHHKESETQWAVWKYFRTWMDNCAEKLEIDETFNYVSENYSNNYGQEILEEAETYYKALTGTERPNIISKDSKEHDSEDGTKKYIGPFRVKNVDNKFIKEEGWKIKNEEGEEQQIATEINGSIVESPEKSTFTNDFYIVIDANDDHVDLNKKFILEYKVLRIKALMSLYTYTQDPSIQQQQVTVVNTAEDTSTLTNEFKVVNIEKDVSLQKYIVETFNSYEEKDGNICNTDGEHSDSDRKNRYATKSSIDREEGIYEDSNNSPVKALEDDTSYKSDNPVNIKPGEYVVYKIEVYKNSNTLGNVGYFSIIDRINKGGKLQRNI